jgi:hypothetical protein
MQVSILPMFFGCAESCTKLLLPTSDAWCLCLLLCPTWATPAELCSPLIICCPHYWTKTLKLQIHGQFSTGELLCICKSQLKYLLRSLFPISQTESLTSPLVFPESTSFTSIVDLTTLFCDYL